MSPNQGISIIVPVTERYDDPEELFRSYCNALEPTGCELQFIYVLDGKYQSLAGTFDSIDCNGHSKEVIRLSRTFGESAVLTVGFERAKHELIMTLPAYNQVDPTCLPKLLGHIGDCDMVIARRWPRSDSWLNRMFNKVFHSILRRMTGVSYSDIGCGVRLMKRTVLDEITVYGDQHRFIPILADRRGFRVVEINLPQSSLDSRLRIYRPSVYVGRLLDLMGVFFLARFTKKPLRFFGMVGSALIFIGIMILVVAVIQKYSMDMALADRPILLLGSLFVVLGAQLLSLGLIGELIIFSHAATLKEYVVAETVNIERDESGETISASNDVVGISRLPSESSRI